VADERKEQDTQWVLYEVFVQLETGKPHEHAGSLRAPDPEMALLNARDVYARREHPVSLWVVPADAITATTSADSGSFFDPADDKAYRHPQFYRTPRGIRPTRKSPSGAGKR
jgi:ring-1,2-phenylacetyl-CoA epoxidase subunit PaaB